MYVYGVNDKTIKFDPILSVAAYMFIVHSYLFVWWCLCVIIYTHIIKDIDRVGHRSCSALCA